MGTYRMHDHRNSITAAAPAPVEIGNGHRIVRASAEDVERWRQIRCARCMTRLRARWPPRRPYQARRPRLPPTSFGCSYTYSVARSVSTGRPRTRATATFQPCLARRQTRTPLSWVAPHRSALGDDRDTRGTSGLRHAATGYRQPLFPLVNPAGGKNEDIYGKGRPIPDRIVQKLMREPKTLEHLLAKGLVAYTDGKGHVDTGRCIECLSVIILLCADEEGSETWGRPRIAERLRANGYSYSNEAMSTAIRMFKNPEWKSGDPIPGPIR